jgi:hypothetical protein
MRFKYWINEILSGPGGGVEPSPVDQERLARTIAAKGAGALPTYGDGPPKTGVSPIKNYLPKARLGSERSYQKKA